MTGDLFGQASTIERSVSFSGDRRHRLGLGRRVGPGRRALLIGVNPSDADGERDDPTIRKLYGFGHLLGIGEWLVGNKFTLVAPDVRALEEEPRPNAPGADEALARMIARADLVIVAWGRLDKLPPGLRNRWREIVRMTEGRDLMCWGTCQDGHPCHPARLPYSTELVRWVEPA